MNTPIGSHHDALESYQRAVALAPSRLIHRVELGRTLHRLGQKEEARLELEVSSSRCTACMHACLHSVLGGRPSVAGGIMHILQLHAHRGSVVTIPCSAVCPQT